MSKTSKKKAELLYDKYLAQIERVYGNKETNNDQLNKLGRKLFRQKYVGTFPSDNIPIMIPGEYAIINLDNSNESGSHWVSIAKTKKKTFIYDSFGRKTYKILPNLLKSGNGIILMTENDPEQNELENNCGQRSIVFLMVLDRHGWKLAKWI